MQTGFWGYFIIVVGIVGVTVIMLFQDVTDTNEQNYYLLKETTEAAMIDSVDIAYYQLNGKVSINKEKFVENFIRRLAESSSLNKEYDIKVYDIVEMPPKVSISLGAKSNVFSFTGEQFNIVNKLDAILETKN